MRKLMILAAAAAVSLACHNRSEDEVGAAPDRGDTTAVAADTTAVTHAIDSTRTGPPGVGGRPGNATVTQDSVGLGQDSVTADSTAAGAGAIDTTTMTGSDTTTTATPQDTLGPRSPDSPAVPSDSAAMDSTMNR